RAGRTVRRDQAQGRVMDEFARAIEATLFASASTLSVEEIGQHVGEGQIEIALGELSVQYEGRGIQLVERGGRWHFQTAPDLAHLLRRTREEPRRLSRAATETLAIIAYHEPVSRAGIDDLKAAGLLDPLDEGVVESLGQLQLESEGEED